jgi:hypothetical protein
MTGEAVDLAVNSLLAARVSQGLPERVTDPTVLARVAAIVVHAVEDNPEKKAS